MLSQLPVMMVATQMASAKEATEAKAILAIRKNFASYFKKFEPDPGYIYGKHTHALLREAQIARDAVDRGECYYAIVNVPPRHGKSDIYSRRLPPWWVGGRPDDEVILASYTSDLAQELNIDGLNNFKESAPLFGLRAGRQRAGVWSVKDPDGKPRKGKVHAVGLNASITGKGANLFIIDDYLKSRQEAESEAVREKLWDSFKSDLWTRRAPVHAFLIVATRWHEDDLAGKIIKEHEKDPSFPKFKLIRFPAQYDDGSYLFPERFSAKYYESQKALGAYAWASLYQNDPKPRRGHLLRADLVNWIEPEEVPDGLVWCRGWDLASTEKERIKDDPDYTVGTLAAYDRKTRRIYVKEVDRGQWTTLKRNERIEQCAKADKARGYTRIYVECVGGYVDTYNTVKAAVNGLSVVRKVTPSLDKVARATILEPAFEAGNVYCVKGSWNEAWEKEFLRFPGGKHDDQVDSLVVALHEQLSSTGVSLSVL